MKRHILCLGILLSVFHITGQIPDTTKDNQRKIKWLIGADGYSALNQVSVIGGVESRKNRYSLSFSHMFGSTRFGAYYDFCISKSYGFWLGVGYHNSFRFSDFGTSRQYYTDSLVRYDMEHAASTISFQPDYGETRLQYFLSIALTKEFCVYKSIFFSFKVMGVYGYNPYYRHSQLCPNGGIQAYLKL
jgi:hypothetical protein